jgi:hypothetical protein
MRTGRETRPTYALCRHRQPLDINQLRGIYRIVGFDERLDHNPGPGRADVVENDAAICSP